MATISDQLLLVTVLAYLLAMVVHAGDYAFGIRARARDRAPARAVPAMAGTGAGAVEAGVGAAGSAVGSPPRASGVGADRAARPGFGQRPGQGSGPGLAAGGRAELLGRAAVASLLLAAVVHAATLVTRGLAAGRLPWANMYEYLLSATLVGVIAWFVMLHRHRSLRHLGLYVALVNLLLLGLVGMIAYTPVEPLRPALDSAWFVIHISAATLAFGILSVGFVGAGLYLLRSGYEAGKRRFPYPLARKLPGAEAVERLTFRLHAFAFPIWTFAIAAGAIWAEAAWGRYWGWDPKEVWAFIAWVAYAAYLHARATPSVRRGVVAWLAVLGYLTMLMNLFGVNLFFESLHSYA